MSEKEIESLAKKAIDHENSLQELLNNLLSKDNNLRYNSFKAILLISEKNPSILYSKWDFFVKLLDSKNAFHRSEALNIIAHLTKSDKEKKFEDLFEKYYSLLDDEKVMIAAHISEVSGMIAMAKPNLQNKITEKLLSIDTTHHEQQRKDLIKAGAIKSFERYFKESKDKEKIVQFIKNQVNCQSPKTQKIAKEFLKKMT